MKQLLLTDWNFMRILRVIGGFALLFAGIIKHDTITGAFGLFFAYQGLFNVSCCGVGGCSTQVPINTNKFDDVDYEEVK